MEVCPYRIPVVLRYIAAMHALWSHADMDILVCIAIAVQFVGLTQESRDELAMYEVKGRAASDFQELSKFSFSVAIEDGLMSKECVC